MQKNPATIIGIAVVIAMLAGIMYGVRAGNPAIPVIAFLAGAALLFLLKRNVTSVIEDEWTRLVEQKAANLTMNVTSFLFTVIALVLITVSSPAQNYYQAVYAIAAVLVTLTAGQVLTTMYFSRTLRGTGP